MAFRLRKPTLHATATSLALLTATMTGVTSASAATAANTANTANFTASPVPLSAAPLGLNTAPWDYVYAANTSAGGGVDVIQPLLKAASINMLRYGGGSYADYYDGQTNTNIQNCLPDNATASFTSSCASSDSLDFSQFSQQARAIGAKSFVTVNYGSGTPALAAQWVTQAKTRRARASRSGKSATRTTAAGRSTTSWPVRRRTTRATRRTPTPRSTASTRTPPVRR